jgi:protein SCO1
MEKKENNLHLIVIAIIAMLAGLWLAQTFQQPAPIKPPIIHGVIYPSEKIILPFSLENHLSEVFTEKDLKDQWSLIFVGYTQCPDVCPTTLALMNEVSNMMRESNKIVPGIIFLSIDPERDTPAILKEYVNYFNPEFIGLTGAIEQINRFSRNLNAVYRKSPGLTGEITADNYLMDHSSALMLINPNGHMQSILTAPHTPGNVIDSILKSQSYYEFVNN